MTVETWTDIFSSERSSEVLKLIASDAAGVDPSFTPEFCHVELRVMRMEPFLSGTAVSSSG